MRHRIQSCSSDDRAGKNAQFPAPLPIELLGARLAFQGGQRDAKCQPPLISPSPSAFRLARYPVV